MISAYASVRGVSRSASSSRRGASTAEWASRCAVRALAIIDSACHLSFGPIDLSSSVKSNSVLPSSSRTALIAVSFFSCAASARFCRSVLGGSGLCIQSGSFTRSTLSTICSISRAWISRPLASTFSGSSSHTLVKTAALSFHSLHFCSEQPSR